MSSSTTRRLSEADLENEKLTEQASLAAFFFEIRGQDALQQLLNDTVDADKKAVELAPRPLRNGSGDQKLSLVEAEGTLQSVQSQAINLGVARAQFEHAIAVLIGANPSQFSIPVKPLLTDAPAIPLGMPSVLLETAAGYRCSGAKACSSERPDRDSVRCLLSNADLERNLRFREFELQPLFQPGE